jgi:hypothetical protein
LSNLIGQAALRIAKTEALFRQVNTLSFGMTSRVEENL